MGPAWMRESSTTTPGIRDPTQTHRKRLQVHNIKFLQKPFSSTQLTRASRSFWPWRIELRFELSSGI